MNKVFIIGNLTRDPELRTTQSGVSVCSFTVAVNRRNKSAEAGQQEADFFRVNVWRELGESCAKYLAKGRKVGVVGPVSVNTYTGNDGQTRAQMEITANEVEFLSPRSDAGSTSAPAQTAPAAPVLQQGGGFVQVDDDELPF